MIPDDLGSLSSALGKKIGNRRVLLFVIELDRSMLVLAICGAQLLHTDDAVVNVCSVPSAHRPTAARAMPAPLF